MQRMRKLLLGLAAACVIVCAVQAAETQLPAPAAQKTPIGTLGHSAAGTDLTSIGSALGHSAAGTDLTSIGIAVGTGPVGIVGVLLYEFFDWIFSPSESEKQERIAAEQSRALAGAAHQTGGTSCKE